MNSNNVKENPQLKWSGVEKQNVESSVGWARSGDKAFKRGFKGSGSSLNRSVHVFSKRFKLAECILHHYGREREILHFDDNKNHFDCSHVRDKRYTQLRWNRRGGLPLNSWWTLWKLGNDTNMSDVLSHAETIIKDLTRSIKHCLDPLFIFDTINYIKGNIFFSGCCVYT